MKKIKATEPDVHLVAVCSTRDAVEAEMIKNTLFDHGIDCQIAGEGQAGFTGTFEIDLLVRESDVEAAKEFLKIHHPHLI